LCRRTQIGEKLNADIEERYSVDMEWPSIILLGNLCNTMTDCANLLVVSRFVDENQEALISQGMTVAEVGEIKAVSEKVQKFSENIPKPVLVESRILLAENVNLEQFDTVLANKRISDLQMIFANGYNVWCEGEVPESIYGEYFRYNFEGMCTVEMTLLNTEQGILLIDAEIDWLDDELFGDISVTYTMPNTVKMYKEAEAAIIREQYASEEEYQSAIAKWLCEKYPNYYGNSANTSSSSVYGSNSYSHGNFNILEELGDVGKDILNTAEDVWSNVGYALEGTVPGYLFTNNGYYRSFADDLSDAAEEVKEVLDEKVSEVKNWWYGLWH